jgi:hypothetical protein
MKRRAIIFLVVIFAAWFPLFLAFKLSRLQCVPLLSDKCLRADWESLGDVVLLNGFGYWQTLFAGVLAIIAAFIGGSYINKQIKQTEALEQRRFRRKQLAARAAMPLALSALLEYAQATGEKLRVVLDQANDQVIPATSNLPSFPEISAEVIVTLQNVIEPSEESVGEKIASLLGRLQVQSARIRSLNSDLRPGSGTLVVTANIEQYVLDVAAIYALGASLLEYARDTPHVLPPTISWADIRRALFHMGFWNTEYPSLYHTVDQRDARNAAP